MRLLAISLATDLTMHTCLMHKLHVRGNSQGSKPLVSKLLTETHEIFMLGRHRHHIYICLFYYEQAIYTCIPTHIFIYLYIKHDIPASFVLNNNKQSSEETSQEKIVELLGHT